MRRRAEAERDLSQARGTNCPRYLPSLDRHRRDPAGHGRHPEETYCILGAWDSAPQLGIISYKAVIGQALLGKRLERQLPTESGTRQVTIVRIDAFTRMDDLREKVHPLSEPATA